MLFAVTSLAEVWIEIVVNLAFNAYPPVTSLAEVWIEIAILSAASANNSSLPLRKCGLKFLYPLAMRFPPSLPLRKCGLKLPCSPPVRHDIAVTSLAEVWIEIDKLRRHFVQCVVTSLAEVWIEM